MADESSGVVHVLDHIHRSDHIELFYPRILSKVFLQCLVEIAQILELLAEFRLMFDCLLEWTAIRVESNYVCPQPCETFSQKPSSTPDIQDI